MKIRVDYDPTPIRHIAVQCPKCENWFHGKDITDDKLSYEHDIYYAQFHCPVCGKIFGANEYSRYANVNIEEVGYPDVYADCLERKAVWE